MIGMKRNGKNLPLGGKYPGSHPPGGLPHQPPPGGDAEDHGDHPDSLAEGLLDDDDDLLAQVNLQLQRESLVKKQRRDLVKPLSAKSSRSSSTDRGCCRIVADAISTFVQVTIELEDTLYFVLYCYISLFVQTSIYLQGIFYCIIFPALVMVGPAGLLYMLYQCYVENDVCFQRKPFTIQTSYRVVFLTGPP